ncbi:MAG: NAD(P)/FAD-dependent oxidoreductase [Chloroflexi bacterium]|nr:NAD(P)/FAD-dependent oxidoreductase [Chloroflexota bacterium]
MTNNNYRIRQIIIGSIIGILTALLSGVAATILIGQSAINMLGGSDDLLIAWLIHLVLGAGIGATYAYVFPTRSDDGYAQSTMSGLVYGVLMWVLLVLNLIPLVMGRGPQWRVEEAVALFPALVTYMLQGVLLGIGCRLVFSVTNLSLDEIEDEAPAPIEVQDRIVILGGGFAGVELAQHLEHYFEDHPETEIALVSNTNHLLFTPMLSEVTSGGVEERHITPPLRTFFKRVRVMRGEPTAVDFENQIVRFATGVSTEPSLNYTHLVFALGSVPNFFGNKNIEANAFVFKSLTDAVDIRNHIIDILERADTEPDPEHRRTLLTFVVVGGGFAGIELIGSLNDLVRGSLWYFPNIDPEEVRLILIHARDRVLPELSESLGRYAQEKMEARGIEFILNARASDAGPDFLKIGEDQVIPTRTLIWTAGNVPNPALQLCGLETDKRGAVIVDEMLRVRGHENVWAIGDNAIVPDVITGETAPPTAQYAQREGKTLAYNIHALMHGQPTKQFAHRSQGTLAVIGHQTAVAEVGGFKFSGLFAWFMWRGIYISKLPTMEKRIRVLLDWVVDVFFPRDLASLQTTLQPQTPPAQPTDRVADNQPAVLD